MGSHRLAGSSAWICELLIDAQHDGALGRGHVETDNIANLGDEIGIG